MTEFVGTAEAAVWLGIPERRLRDWCIKGRIEGAFQWEPGCKWDIPTATLLKRRACPESLRAELTETADTAEIA